MSCKSALYAANTSPQAMATGEVINFGTIVRRYGNNIGLSGGNVTVMGSGYYDIDANISLTLSAAGSAIITLYKDGTAIPGAEAAIVAADAGTFPVTIPALVRQMCNCQSIITAVITGAGVVANAAVVAKKV